MYEFVFPFHTLLTSVLRALNFVFLSRVLYSTDKHKGQTKQDLIDSSSCRI